jgi:hypothetical protein
MDSSRAYILDSPAVGRRTGCADAIVLDTIDATARAAQNATLARYPARSAIAGSVCRIP